MTHMMLFSQSRYSFCGEMMAVNLCQWIAMDFISTYQILGLVSTGNYRTTVMLIYDI